MLRRLKEFRVVAEYVAATLADIPDVQKVALSVRSRSPLQEEIPRFRRFRHFNCAILHECMHVDLPVWISDLENLKTVQKARDRVLNNFKRKGNSGLLTIKPKPLFWNRD